VKAHFPAKNETIERQNYERITRAYCHLLADVHLAGFAPAFTLSQCDSEYTRKPQDAHSLSRYASVYKKRKTRHIFAEKSK